MTGYIAFYIVGILISLLFVRKKSGLFVFLSVFTFFIVANTIVHTVSINVGKEGYSIFTKKILPDEQIYYLEAKELYLSFVEENHAFSLSQNDKDVLGKNYYSIFLFFVFLFFSSSEIIMARAVTSLFSALLFLQVHRFIRETSTTQGLKPIVFMLLFYPTLLIRGLQIEQEMLINFLVVIIINLALLKNKSPHLIHYISLLLVKVIGFVSLLLARFSKVMKFNFGFMLQFIMLPVLIIYAIKILSPDTFNYVVAVKSYVVMDGRTDIIQVDYDSIFGIIMTTTVSWYYYLFAPLDISTILGGSLSFKILLFEPVFLIVTIVFLYINRKHLETLPNLKWVIYFLFYYSLIYILGESHITSLMRRRIVVYIFGFMLLGYVLNKVKLIFSTSKTLNK